AGDGCGRGTGKIGCMPNGLGFTVRQVYLLRDHGGRDYGGPVDAEGAGRGGWCGGVETGVAGQRELDRGIGERAAYLSLVGVLDGDPQVRGGLLVGRRVRVVEAEQADIELTELFGAAEHLGQQGDSLLG